MRGAPSFTLDLFPYFFPLTSHQTPKDGNKMRTADTGRTVEELADVLVSDEGLLVDKRARSGHFLHTVALCIT